MKEILRFRGVKAADYRIELVHASKARRGPLWLPSSIWGLISPRGLIQMPTVAPPRIVRAAACGPDPRDCASLEGPRPVGDRDGRPQSEPRRQDGGNRGQRVYLTSKEYQMLELLALSARVRRSPKRCSSITSTAAWTSRK